MHIISEIDQLFGALRSPMRSQKKDFIAFRMEDFDKTPHVGSMNCLRTMFYRISIHLHDSIEWIVNNGTLQRTKMYTLSFFSPFHLLTFEQKSDLQGLSFQFSELFMHYAYESSQFQRDFPFFWNNQNIFFLVEQDARLLIQLAEKIIHEYKVCSQFSENIIRDYIHIFLLEAKRMIGIRQKVEDCSADYSLLQQFYQLVNKSNPLIRSVEYAAGSLCVTQAHLWMVVKKLTGQTPSDIINQRVLLEAQSLLSHSGLTISEIGFLLQFREKSHFTRFFKNMAGMSPSSYSSQSGFRNR